MLRLRYSRLTLRHRLTLAVAAILVTGFLVTDILSFRASTATLKHTIMHDELPLTSSNIYSEIQADLLQPILVSSLMAQDTFVRDWLLSGEKDVPAATRYLDEIHQKYGFFTSFLISDRSRAYYHFTGLYRHIDETKPEDQWFARVREMAAPYEINVDYNQESNDALTIFVNYRVLDYDGKFLGVAGVGLKLDAVANIIARYHNEFQRNVYFVDGTGKIVVRSPDAAITEDNILTAPGISTVARSLLASGEGYQEYVRDGETILLTTRFIPQLGWHVIVEQRERDAFRGLWRGFLVNLAIGFAIIGLTVLMVSYTINLYQRRLEEMAVTDKLTGIGNRQLFETALDQALITQRRTGRTFSLILFDLDHFKRINDTFGHVKGDEVIRRVADAARHVVRASNLLCRWGGEELIVLLDNCTCQDAHDVAERLRAAIADHAPFLPDDGTRITISVGVTEVRDGDRPDTIVARADTALYRAKQNGRNRVEAEAA